ncbi:MAG TPA: GNAT family N-acetyltransferase [Acetobacteraceae bacterium]|nr:GNAT family N-acetyltransferase [Acetobacteraceae bacterium]
MRFSLRTTTQADVPALHRLMRDFAAYEKLEHRFAITEATLHEALFAPAPPLSSILIEVGGEAVGFALWYFTFGTFAGRWNLFVEDVYVDGAHRGQGIGMALFRHMAHVAQERGCAAMTWQVLDWNTPAIEFYRHIGARPVRGWIAQELSGVALTALAEGEGNG